MRQKRSGSIKTAIKDHILNNRKEYIIALLVFIIGIFIGVLFVNNTQEEQIEEITKYLDSFLDKLKNMENINNTVLIKTSILKNILLGVIIWFFGTTVIGIPIVFGIILYRGFCLGYTISTCIVTMGLSKGLIFVIFSLLLQNIIFIPAILALSVSRI